MGALKPFKHPILVMTMYEYTNECTKKPFHYTYLFSDGNQKSNLSQSQMCRSFCCAGVNNNYKDYRLVNRRLT